MTSTCGERKSPPLVISLVVWLVGRLVAWLTGTAIRSSFINPPNRPGCKWTDWANIRLILKDSDQLGVTRQEPIDKAVEELASDRSIHPQVSTACRPVPPIPSYFQDNICPKNELRRLWRSTRDLALKAQVNGLNCSVTHQLNE
jgi:hypothetical protein